MSAAGNFAKHLKAGDIVLLKGQLGAGKTTFTKGLAEGFKIKKTSVNSPTFILMNFYEGKLPVYHFDFYRIERVEHLFTVDLDEYFYGNGIAVIEWPERLGELLPKEFFQVSLEHKSEEERVIKFSASGESYLKRLKQMLKHITSK